MREKDDVRAVARKFCRENKLDEEMETNLVAQLEEHIQNYYNARGESVPEQDEGDYSDKKEPLNLQLENGDEQAEEQQSDEGTRR